jgi:hypothetical protein
MADVEANSLDSNILLGGIEVVEPLGFRLLEFGNLVLDELLQCLSAAVFGQIRCELLLVLRHAEQVESQVALSVAPATVPGQGRGQEPPAGDQPVATLGTLPELADNQGRVLGKARDKLLDLDLAVGLPASRCAFLVQPALGHLEPEAAIQSRYGQHALANERTFAITLRLELLFPLGRALGEVLDRIRRLHQARAGEPMLEGILPGPCLSLGRPGAGAPLRVAPIRIEARFTDHDAFSR